ncbi:hypothetical protein D5086_025044 [Populus alba]|uniref:Uncharacterized protein n=1 Tax=Populus alba TaxID=43335 RepID=A0ACC4B815_POPAL
MALLDQSFFHYSLLAYYLLGPPTFIALRFFQFPYGKHNRLGWGPTIPPPLAWFIMESPSILLPLILFPFGQHFTNPKALLLMSPYLLHYFHRTFIYPLRIYQSTSHQNTKTTIGFPLILTFNGFLTQALNTCIQARWVSHYKSDYDSDGEIIPREVPSIDKRRGRKDDEKKPSIAVIQVFLIGKDFGSITAYLVAVVHPERVSFISCVFDTCLSDPREPGRAEADFGRLDVKTVVRNVYILFSGTEPPTARDDQEIMDLVDPSTLPPWFSEEDLAAYASLYEKSGFRFALQVPYRSLGIDCGITNPKVTAPTLLINGQKDYLLKFAGMEDYTRSEQLKHFVPDLDIVFLDEGNHFVHENLPKQVNELIITFLTKHSAEGYPVIMDLIDLYTSSPPSFSEEDLAVYVVSESG